MIARALHHLKAFSRDPERAAPVAVFVVVALLLGALLPAQGLTDDDDFYAPAGIRYVGYLGDVVTEPARALSWAGLDAAFEPNHEHPPLAKVVMGLAHAVFHRALPIFESLDGARFGTSLLCALLCAVLCRLLWRPLGPLAALAAPVLLLSLPRFLFHSQVATLDVPVAALVVCVVAAFFWAEQARRGALLVGVVFGLALLTKLNAPFAAVPCVLFVLLSRWRGFGLDRAAAAIILPPVPKTLWAMALLGPLLFVLLWPWLWHAPLQRLGAYFAFHLAHYPIYLFYDGVIYAKPFAPWHAPVVMAFAVMPAPVLVLGVLGTVASLSSLRRLLQRASADGDHAGAGDRLLVLVLLQAVFALGVVAFSNVPKYGGEKLFMPFFPLWCVLAAAGLRLVVNAARALSPRLPLVPLSVAVVVVAGPGVAASFKHHGGFALSYYGEAVGGLRGAVARGYERTYYDVADKELARLLDSLDRDGALQVHFEPNHKEYARTYRWLARDGVVDRRLRLTAKPRDAGLLVLTHERRWSTYPALLQQMQKHPVVAEKRIDGVPLWTVYRPER